MTDGMSVPVHLDQAVAPRASTPSSPAARPLCVDLDGTLVKTDTLVDALLVMVRSHSGDLLRVPGWVSRGKAFFKEQVTKRVALDVAHLPYNKPLRAYLEQQRGLGRDLYLATGADGVLARRVAAHLGIFADVLASDGATNLTGHNKLAAFQARFGEQGFDYIGNAKPDVPLLAQACEAMVANPDGHLRAAMRAGKFKVAQQFLDQRSAFKSLRKAMRMHQWAKNLLIFLPMLLAHAIGAHAVVQALVAFLSFSLCASGTYILNDLLDIEADRRHPRKRLRPFASGDLQGKTGVLLAGGLLLAAFALCVALPQIFLLWLLGYLATTLSYSFYFKRQVLIDVVLLSGLYTLRLLAGGAADSVAISPWMAAFSIFLFLSLAIVKRFAELQNIKAAEQMPSNGRGYLLSDIEQMRAFGTAAAYASVVVFALYINGLESSGFYHHSQRLWLIAPIMILWISRVWLLASRGELDEDPVIFAVTDKVSLLLGAVTALVVVLADV